VVIPLPVLPPPPPPPPRHHRLRLHGHHHYHRPKKILYGKILFVDIVGLPIDRDPAGRHSFLDVEIFIIGLIAATPATIFAEIAFAFVFFGVILMVLTRLPSSKPVNLL
jgi:hypothetical protein